MILFETDYLGMNGLHWAVKRNHFKTVKILIEKGALIDQEDF